jgi:PST family polysaccharide transporter
MKSDLLPGHAEMGGSYEHHFNTGHLLKGLGERSISSGVVVAMSQATQFGLNLVATMFLARMLLPRDFGVVAMVLTVMSFLRVFKDIGLSTATIQKEGITHAQVSNLFWINLAVSGAISAMLAASAPLIAWFYHEPSLVKITLALSATLLLNGAMAQPLAILSRQMRFKLIAMIQITSLLAAVLLAIGMAWWNCGYWSLVGFQLAVPALACVLTWVLSRWRPQLPSRNSGIRSMLQFGANLSAGGLVWSTARGSDGLFIGRVWGPASIGLYSRAAALLNRPMEMAIMPLESVLVPTLSRLQSDPASYRRIFLQVFEFIALATSFVSALVFVLARPLTLVILGHKWEQAAPIFAAFTISALYFPVSTASTWLFASQGRGRDSLRTSLLCSGVTVLAFLAGLPFGPVGVAISFSAASLLILLPIHFGFAGREGCVTAANLWGAFLRQVPVWAVVCGAVWPVRVLAAHFAPLTQLVVCGAVGVLASAVFISVYPPSRRTALGFRDALQTLKSRS